MPTSVKGIYRNGKIELLEVPDRLAEETTVIVIFLESNEVDLSSSGITPEEAMKLRANLATFADDWDSPEMSIYDDYDATKSND